MCSSRNLRFLVDLGSHGVYNMEFRGIQRSVHRAEPMRTFFFRGELVAEFCITFQWHSLCVCVCGGISAHVCLEL